jgi:hypothetical protein
MTITNTHPLLSRHGKKWTIPETLSLQREYELLALPTDQIAELHSRTENAILMRVETEGFELSSDSNEKKSQTVNGFVRNTTSYLALIGLTVLCICIVIPRININDFLTD